MKIVLALILGAATAHADKLTPLATQGPWKSVRDWCDGRPAKSQDRHCGQSHYERVDGDLKLENPSVQLVIETERTDGPRFDTTDVGGWLAIQTGKQLWFSATPIFGLNESEGWREDRVSGLSMVAHGPWVVVSWTRRIEDYNADSTRSETWSALVGTGPAPSVTPAFRTSLNEDASRKTCDGEHCCSQATPAGCAHWKADVTFEPGTLVIKGSGDGDDGRHALGK